MSGETQVVFDENKTGSEIAGQDKLTFSSQTPDQVKTSESVSDYLKDYVLVSPFIMYRVLGPERDFVSLSLEGLPYLELNCQRRLFAVSPNHGRWHHTLIAISKEHWLQFAKNLIQSAIWDEKTGIYIELLFRKVWVPDGTKRCPVYGIEVHGTIGSYFFKYEEGWSLWSGGGCAPYADFLTLKKPSKDSVDLDGMMKRLVVTDQTLINHPYFTALQDSYEAAQISTYLQTRRTQSNTVGEGTEATLKANEC